MWWLPILVQAHLDREAEERARADALAAEARAKAAQDAADAEARAAQARAEKAQTDAGIEELRRARADLVRQVDAIRQRNRALAAAIQSKSGK